MVPTAPKPPLSGKTILVSGGSRGIGLAIAKRAGRDGANLVLLAKTDQPHPKLEGTIHTAAAEVEAAGGQALPIVTDIRQPAEVQAAVEKAVERFGGIDILVNNASAIRLTGTAETSVKRYDLMHEVNGRGTYACAYACLPFLKKAQNPHILTLSPPLNLRPEWFGPYPAYAVTKYTMSLFAMAWAEEFRAFGIASNALWPRTTIGTAAIKNIIGGEEMMQKSRTPDIMADAAHHILSQPSQGCTGSFFIDDEVLLAAGVRDLSVYDIVPGAELQGDLFLDPLPGINPIS